MAVVNLTQARKLVHERFRAAIEAPDRNSLTPALDLSKSLRALNAGQLGLLDLLLRVYAEHPSTTDQYRLAAMLAAKVTEEG